MATSQMSAVIQHLRTTVLVPDGAGLTDGQLLNRFIEGRDEDAFAALVKRHAPMVWGVCRRLLANHHDAEDAFQATFLVLVRKAATVRPREMVANWLYGVACMTAHRGKVAAAKSRRRERQVTEMPEPALPEPDLWADLRPLLDQELSRLPDLYRVVVVLCDLEGKTRKEVARQLGCPEGTVASRLARAREMLAKRLARNGLGVAGGDLAVALTQNVASTGVPASVVSSTIKAAKLLAAGQAVAAGAVAAKVAALTEGVLRIMFVNRLNTVTTVLVMLAMIGFGGGLYTHQSAGAQPGQANPDGLRERVVELKQQLQQMQRKIARLEQETQPRRNERKTCDTAFLANRFKYRVPFETGLTQTKDGGRIEIREVWGTRPRIEVGGQYLVRGKYVLPPGERGKLYFYATAGGAWGALRTTLDLQSTTVDKQEGEFALVHGMSGPGSFHLILTAAESYSRWFANVYFGTGDNVYRRKR